MYLFNYLNNRIKIQYMTGLIIGQHYRNKNRVFIRHLLKLYQVRFTILVYTEIINLKASFCKIM